MPRPKPHTAKVIRAHERLAVLQAQQSADSAELERLELDLKETIAKRGGVAAIADSSRLVEAARAQLQATKTELDEVMRAIPLLELESDREETTADLLRAAREACSAAADVGALLNKPETPFKVLLENLQSAYLRLESARAAYDYAGHELLPGWETRGLYEQRERWEGNGPDRKKLEADLREKGADLGAVTQELAADPARADDFVYQAGWRAFQFVQQARRFELARAEQERENERRRIQAAEANRREEEREARAFSATLTYPLTVHGEVMEALRSLVIKGSETFRQRVPGAKGDIAEFGRLALAQPDVVKARALLYEALGKDWTVENVLFQNDPQSGWDERINYSAAL